MSEVPICVVDGCTNLATWATKRKNGSKIYRPYCNGHYESLVRKPSVRKEERPMCRIPGCESLVAVKGRYANGSPIYRSVCQTHHRKHKAPTDTNEWGSCVRCSWRGLLHRHRIVPGKDGGKYVQGNVLRLCPNCHSAEHGDGEMNQPQVYPKGLGIR